MKLIKILRNKYFIAGTLFAIWVIFFDQNSLVEWRRAKKEVNHQMDEKLDYEKKITQTRQKLRELQSNRDSLEIFARETYFFLKEGEEIFIVEEKAR